MMDVTLASASPRRRTMLTMLGLPFAAITVDVDERSIPYRTPRDLALKAAYSKACAAEKELRGGLIVAADTVVALDSDVFGKPDDEDHACQMLARLAGRRHVVLTGVAVKEWQKAALVDVVESGVWFNPLTPAEIDDYVVTGEPMDKAGAYAVQGIGRRLVARVDGDYFNVVGLPLRRLVEILASFMDTSALLPALVRMEAEAQQALRDGRTYP